MKTTVSEAEHPLLCEGTRRVKGDLALALMITYKDDQSKLKKVTVRGKVCVALKAEFSPPSLSSDDHLGIIEVISYCSSCLFESLEASLSSTCRHNTPREQLVNR